MFNLVKIAIAQGLPDRLVPDCSPTGTSTSTPACDACQLALMANNIITTLIYAAFIILIIMAITGGIRMFFSAGKSENLQTARKHITAAIIGLVIVLVSWTAINYIFVNFTSLENNPKEAKWYELGKHLECKDGVYGGFGGGGGFESGSGGGSGW